MWLLRGFALVQHLVLAISLLSVLVHGNQINTASQQLLDACKNASPQDDQLVEIRAVLSNNDTSVNINVQHPTNGQTPLMMSVLMGKANVVEMLLQQGADPTLPEMDGYTPAHGAAFQGHTNVLRILQRYNAAPQNYHADGYLPFHRACWGNTQRHADFVQYMLQSGLVSDPNVLSKNGKTCREMTQNQNTIQVLDAFDQAEL